MLTVLISRNKLCFTWDVHLPRSDANQIRGLVHHHMQAGCGWGEELVSGYIPLTASPARHRPLVTRDPAWGMHTHSHVAIYPPTEREMRIAKHHTSRQVTV